MIVQRLSGLVEGFCGLFYLLIIRRGRVPSRSHARDLRKLSYYSATELKKTLPLSQPIGDTIGYFLKNKNGFIIIFYFYYIKIYRPKFYYFFKLT